MTNEELLDEALKELRQHALMEIQAEIVLAEPRNWREWRALLFKQVADVDVSFETPGFRYRLLRLAGMAAAAAVLHQYRSFRA
jgi:hypothetical protein